MDPNETLQDIVERARVVQYNVGAEMSPEQDNAWELAERVLALHEWLSRGGFLPAAWATPEANVGRVQDIDTTEPPPTRDGSRCGYSALIGERGGPRHLVPCVLEQGHQGLHSVVTL